MRHRKVEHPLKLAVGCVFSLVLGVAGAQQGPGHAHHNFPRPVMDFHQIMAPLWHSPPGDARRGATCAAAKDLLALAETAASAPVPEAVAAADRGNWADAVSALKAETGRLEPACSGGGAVPVDEALAGIHHAFHEVVALVGHRH